MRNRILFFGSLLFFLVWMVWPGGKGVPRHPDRRFTSDLTRQENGSVGNHSSSSAPLVSARQMKSEYEAPASADCLPEAERDPTSDLTEQDAPPPPEEAVEAGQIYGLDVSLDDNEHSAVAPPEEETDQNLDFTTQEDPPPAEESLQAGRVYPLNRQ